MATFPVGFRARSYVRLSNSAQPPSKSRAENRPHRKSIFISLFYAMSEAINVKTRRNPCQTLIRGTLNLSGNGAKGLQPELMAARCSPGYGLDALSAPVEESWRGIWRSGSPKGR